MQAPKATNQRRRMRAQNLANPENREPAIEGLPFIAAYPKLFVTRAIEKMSYLWAPNCFVIRYVYLPFNKGQSRKYGPPGELNGSMRKAVTSLEFALAT